MAVDDVTEANIVEVLALAESTPQRLRASTLGLDDTRLSTSHSPDEWSPLQILNHLRACEEVWTHSVYAMLAHDTPRLKEIHPRQWIKTTNPYTTQPFSSGLQVFTLRREALLITLRGLSISDWERDCRIDRKTHTVYSHIRRLVLHEKTHCEQVEAFRERM